MPGPPGGGATTVRSRCPGWRRTSAASRWSTSSNACSCPALTARDSTRVTGAAAAGDHEPVAADDIAGHGTGVLEQKRARPSAQRRGDPLDAHEAGRPIRAGGLEELDDPVTGDVAAEALLDVNPRQHRALGRLLVRRRLVLVHCDHRVRAHPG